MYKKVETYSPEKGRKGMKDINIKNREILKRISLTFKYINIKIGSVTDERKLKKSSE